MKNIVLFIDNLGSGGAQRQVANVACLLKQSGYSVRVLVYQDIPFYKPILDNCNIPVVLVKNNGKLSRILNVRKYLNHSETDVVIAFLETPGFIACLSKIGHKKWKLVTTERSAKESTFSSRRNRFFNLFERFAAAKVGNSNNAMNLWRKYYPQYSDKYSVIYNYIAIPEEYLVDRCCYLEDGRLKITVAASYQELKNPLRVIEAVNLLSKEQKEKLQINWYGRAEVTTGDTRIYDMAQEKVKEYGLQQCIHLNGETSEIYKAMAESDAVGLFSTVEGLPNTICEAMTIGRPVLMSKVSDYDVLVTDNGVLCDPMSVESIRDALVKMLHASPGELLEMGQASKKKANLLFSSQAITEQWVEIVEK